MAPLLRDVRLGLFALVAVTGMWLVVHMLGPSRRHTAASLDAAPVAAESAPAQTRSAGGDRGVLRAAPTATAAAPAVATHAPLDTCHTQPNTEYEGPVVIWGSNNLKQSAAECCASCREHRAAAETRGDKPCTLWVWCGREGGCDKRPFGECWGKSVADIGTNPPRVRNKGPACAWTSGAALTDAEAVALAEAEAAVLAERELRRTRPGTPRVFFDISIDGKPTGRIEFALYAHEAPRAAENFRAMCTGERGGKATFKNMRFYRIIDRFIDQAGVDSVRSIWNQPFDDDPGGLKLHHEREGLLSVANSGPDSNTGHFSIVVAPAPHLDGGYVVFGEVVSGMDVVMAINKLTTPGTDRVTGNAVVTDAGCLQNCALRPEVGPKCKTRSDKPEKRQGRTVAKPCLD